MSASSRLNPQPNATRWIQDGYEIFILALILGLVCGFGCQPATAPTTPVSTQIPTNIPYLPLTSKLQVRIDPENAGEFILNPTPLGESGYPMGMVVTVDVIPREGWKLDRWAGLFDKAGNTAKNKDDIWPVRSNQDEVHRRANEETHRRAAKAAHSQAHSQAHCEAHVHRGRQRG